MSTQKFATNALHAGHDVTKTAGTRAVGADSEARGCSEGS